MMPLNPLLEELQKISKVAGNLINGKAEFNLKHFTNGYFFKITQMQASQRMRTFLSYCKMNCLCKNKKEQNKANAKTEQ